YALGRALTLGGRVVVRQVRTNPHATIACAAAIAPPIVEVTLGPVAGRVAGLAADAVIVAVAVHAARQIAREHGVWLGAREVARIAAHEDLKNLRSTAIFSAVGVVLSLVPPASVAFQAVEAARAADRAVRIVSIARTEATRLALAA
ncbi:MAG: hypothetical protein ACXVCJ_28630, partial [Polyangiales bacterium]